MRESMFQTLLITTAVLLLPGAPVAAQADKQWNRSEDKQNVSMVYLVRHAEKADTGKDPELTDIGKQRADELARMLKDAGVTHIWSTDYKRTRTTAEPLATRLRLKVEIYDPAKLG